MRISSMRSNTFQDDVRATLVIVEWCVSASVEAAVARVAPEAAVAHRRRGPRGSAVMVRQLLAPGYCSRKPTLAPVI